MQAGSSQTLFHRNPHPEDHSGKHQNRLESPLVCPSSSRSEEPMPTVKRPSPLVKLNSSPRRDTDMSDREEPRGSNSGSALTQKPAAVRLKSPSEREIARNDVVQKVMRQKYEQMNKESKKSSAGTFFPATKQPHQPGILIKSDPAEETFLPAPSPRSQQLNLPPSKQFYPSPVPIPAFPQPLYPQSAYPHPPQPIQSSVPAHSAPGHSQYSAPRASMVQQQMPPFYGLQTGFIQIQVDGVLKSVPVQFFLPPGWDMQNQQNQLSDSQLHNRPPQIVPQAAPYQQPPQQSRWSNRHSQQPQPQPQPQPLPQQQQPYQKHWQTQRQSQRQQDRHTQRKQERQHQRNESKGDGHSPVQQPAPLQRRSCFPGGIARSKPNNSQAIKIREEEDCYTPAERRYTQKGLAEQQQRSFYSLQQRSSLSPRLGERESLNAFLRNNAFRKAAKNCIRGRDDSFSFDRNKHPESGLKGKQNSCSLCGGLKMSTSALCVICTKRKNGQLQTPPTHQPSTLRNSVDRLGVTRSHFSNPREESFVEQSSMGNSFTYGPRPNYPDRSLRQQPKARPFSPKNYYRQSPTREYRAQAREVPRRGHPIRQVRDMFKLGSKERR